jgi:hypothetical protein
LACDTLRLHVTGCFNNRYDNFQVSLSVAPDKRDLLAGALRDILDGTRAKLLIT